MAGWLDDHYLELWNGRTIDGVRSLLHAQRLIPHRRSFLFHLFSFPFTSATGAAVSMTTNVRVRWSIHIDAT